MAAGTSTSATSSPGCVRDVASDFRWLSWLQVTFTGTGLMAQEAAWQLRALEDGASYLQVAADMARDTDAKLIRIRDIYRRVLGRAASDAEAAGWLPATHPGGISAVVPEIAASDEAHRHAGGTDARWLAHLYSAFMGGPIDAAGRDYWLARLNSGASRRSVAASIWASPASVRRRTDAAYRLVLGRPGDSGGLTYWSTTTLAYGDEVVAAALAATDAGWGRAQVHFDAPAGPLPPVCPRHLSWIPDAGTIVRTLAPVAHFGANLATLTFDDGPNPTWTPQILDILARYRIRATFFMVGNAARAYPDLVRRIVAEGHHVAIHTMSHPNLLTLGRAGQYSQIVGSKEVVEGIAGPGSVRCFRPPYGNRNATTDAIAAEAGLATIMWSRDGRDWARPGVDAIVEGNLSTRYDGGRAVLLLHDGGVDRSQTVAALPRMIDALTARGYQFVQIC